MLSCIRYSVSATGQVRVSQSALLRQPCGDDIQVRESPHNVLVKCPLECESVMVPPFQKHSEICVSLWRPVGMVSWLACL